MSEHAPKGHEQFTAPHEAEQHEAAHHKAHPEHEARHEKQELAPIKELEQQAKEEAVVAKELVSHEKGGHDPAPQFVQRELKENTFNRSMTRIRKQLPYGEKVLSKAIHQPVVDTVSQVGAKTVARPSGLLMGSICAFVGSSFFLWAAKHYGFHYNYLLFVIFFAGGFVLGLFLEMLLFVLRRNKAS